MKLYRDKYYAKEEVIHSIEELLSKGYLIELSFEYKVINGIKSLCIKDYTSISKDRIRYRFDELGIVVQSDYKGTKERINNEWIHYPSEEELERILVPNKTEITYKVIHGNYTIRKIIND